jgi:S-adenosylmethionine synthetase
VPGRGARRAPLTIETAALDPARRRLEVVERKGLGHPDTLCDTAAELFSRQLSRHYLGRTGCILHHNVDKALLVGGQTQVHFGGGAWLAPIVVTLAGRATGEIDGRPVPLRDIAEVALARTIAPVRYLEPSQVELRVATRPGAPELRETFERAGAVPLANDTSIGVGFAPLSPTEKVALEIDRALFAISRSEPESPIGEDVKVMVARKGDALRITVATAMVACCTPAESAYRGAVERVAARARAVGRSAGFDRVEVEVNAADDVPRSVYLTLSGTSAECGDDGQVGRGNRLCGLITPMRPMTMEALAGKNPRTHVGKLLSLAATRAARSCAGLPGVRAAECVLVSRIGSPVDRPHAVGLRLDATRAAARGHREEIASLVQRELDAIPTLWREIVEGQEADLRSAPWPL